MSDGATSYRLEGLEPDNLLAFLALLGVLRALEADDQKQSDEEKLNPRAAWDIPNPPLRPLLHLSREIGRDTISERAARGLDLLAEAHEFNGRKDLNYVQNECRDVLRSALVSAGSVTRHHVDLLAALMTDAAIKDEKTGTVDPTPLCLLFGQGHQHFLERLVLVPREPVPPARGKQARSASAADSITAALFEPWTRRDKTFSFRWDPEEDVRYALMAGDPTDGAYKSGTQHGANRLAAVGLAVLTTVPERQGTRVRTRVIGGTFAANGFSFAWPIHTTPASLAAIRSLLAHPLLRSPSGISHLGVVDVMVARRISVGKFMNFSRARPLSAVAGSAEHG